ncbi:efflux RND transporter periplasmic adaptor subunit [soil metagenome]
MNARILVTILWCFPLSACTQVASSSFVKPAATKINSSETLVVTAEQERNMNISTTRVCQKVLPELVRVSGQVEADANMTTPVTSPVSGRIEDVTVRLGDKVRIGQVLARLRSDDVTQIESDLLKSVMEIEADREQNKVELALTSANLARQKALIEQGIAARADLETAIRDHEKAKAALSSLEGKRSAAITSASERLRLYGAPPREAERVLATKTVDNKFEIKAPESGVISSRYVNPGQLVDPSKALFVISDLSKVWLVARVFEKDISKIRIGQSVQLLVDSYPGQNFTGQIDYIADNISPESRTLAVRATVPNGQHLLKPQMFARMNIRTGSSSVLAVPLAAVQKTGEVNIAYVPLSDNRFEERKLILGRIYGSNVAVSSGLKRGEQVVVNGSLELNGKAIQQHDNE